MSYKAFFGSLMIGCTISVTVLANSFGVPERPTNVSPSQGEMDVSTTPTLTSTAYEVLDDSNNPIGTAALTESEWLIYNENGVTLVGGTNLTGADRDNTETVGYDVSSAALSLSGSSVVYAVINHKRLELQDGSNNLLGYIELPSFFWQADNMDTYRAARLKIFNDAVVVEWYYGDSSAVTPWDMKIQGVLRNNELGIKFLDSSFDSTFANNYGSNTINFCDESTCFAHSLTNIYNTGNVAVCELPDVGSDCSVTSLYSGGLLDDLNLSVVEYGTSLSTSFALMNALMESSSYTWVVRHAGTIDGSTEIAGGWSNATSFTTGVEEAGYSLDDLSINLVSDPSGDLYPGLLASYELQITNVGSVDVEAIAIQIHYEYGNSIPTFPEFCNEDSEYFFTCVLSVLSPGDTPILSFLTEFTTTGDQINFSYSVCLQNIIACTEQVSTGYSTVKDLNELTDYHVTTLLGSSYELVDLNNVPVNISIENISNYSGMNSDVYINWTGELSVSSAGESVCELLEEGPSFSRVKCSFSGLAIAALSSENIGVNLSAEQDITQDTILTISVDICENGYCNGFERAYTQEISVIAPVTDPKEDVDQGGSSDQSSNGSESSGGGSLWILPLLGLFLIRRRNIKA